jgi:hypothetical protein
MNIFTPVFNIIGQQFHFSIESFFSCMNAYENYKIGLYYSIRFYHSSIAFDYFFLFARTNCIRLFFFNLNNKYRSIPVIRKRKVLRISHLIYIYIYIR